MVPPTPRPEAELIRPRFVRTGHAGKGGVYQVGRAVLEEARRAEASSDVEVMFAGVAFRPPDAEQRAAAAARLREAIAAEGARFARVDEKALRRKRQAAREAAKPPWPELPPSPHLDTLQRRYAMQNALRAAHPSCRERLCGRVPRFRQGDNETVAVRVEVGANGRAGFRDLFRCGNAWICPLCAPAVTQKQREDLVAAVADIVKRGGTALLLNLTVPHRAGQGLAMLTEALALAWRKFQASRDWAGGRKALGVRAELGVVATVRSLEVTWGVQHGWHPHLHILVFCEPDAELGFVVDRDDRGDPWDDEATATMAELRELGLEVAAARREASFDAARRLSVRLEQYALARIAPAWQKAVEHAGLGTPSLERGCKLIDGAGAATYAAKWGAADELVKTHVKGGRAGRRRGAGDAEGSHLAEAPTSVTPWRLLAAMTDGEVLLVGDDDVNRHVTPDEAEQLFREFAVAFKGRSRLHWSRGGRAALGLGREELQLIADIAEFAINEQLGEGELADLNQAREAANMPRASARVSSIRPSAPTGLEPTPSDWDLIVSFGLRGALLRAAECAVHTGTSVERQVAAVVEIARGKQRQRLAEFRPHPFAPPEPGGGP